MELITSRKTLVLTTLILLSITLSSGLPGKSSIAKELSPQELFAASDIVVVGKVLEIKAQWGIGDGSSVYTAVRIQVDEYQKGENKGRMIEVIYSGGTVGDFGLWVEDQPTFQIDEYVRLYLQLSGSTQPGATPRYSLTTDTFMGKESLTPTGMGITKPDVFESLTISVEDVVLPLMIFTLSVSLLVMGLNKGR